MTRNEIEVWATAYIQAQQDPDILKGNHPLWWAAANFMLPVSSSATPDDCWQAIIEVLARNPPDKVVGMLAAGPLEDLIEYHGAEFIDRIETESRRSASFHHLLGGVWESSTPEVWARVQKARGDHW